MYLPVFCFISACIFLDFIPKYLRICTEFIKIQASVLSDFKLMRRFGRQQAQENHSSARSGSSCDATAGAAAAGPSYPSPISCIMWSVSDLCIWMYRMYLYVSESQYIQNTYRYIRYIKVCPDRHIWNNTCNTYWYILIHTNLVIHADTNDTYNTSDTPSYTPG